MIHPPAASPTRSAVSQLVGETSNPRAWQRFLVRAGIPHATTCTSRTTFPSHKSQLDGRSMLVRRAKVLPIEAIVRGYITGSGWKEYKKEGTVHGLKLPEGLQESQEIPGGPIFTPSTKAEQGEHDENIHPDQGKSTPLLLFPQWSKRFSTCSDARS